MGEFISLTSHQRVYLSNDISFIMAVANFWAKMMLFKIKAIAMNWDIIRKGDTLQKLQKVCTCLTVLHNKGVFIYSRCWAFIHSFWWPTNGRAGNGNTRSALMVSNGTPRVRCVCAYLARCSKSLLWATRCVDYFCRNMLDLIHYVFIV